MRCHLLCVLLHLTLGRIKKELAAHPIDEGSEQGKSICAELNHVNDETHSITVAPGEPIALVLNLSTTPASLEQSLVKPETGSLANNASPAEVARAKSNQQNPICLCWLWRYMTGWRMTKGVLGSCSNPRMCPYWAQLDT
jgi:hypothetical protein